jgi:hypothetical protein
VGIGSKVRFWHDVWCSDQLLKHVFPSLFSIARYKEAWVKENFFFDKSNIISKSAEGRNP